MPKLSAAGAELVRTLAVRHGVSDDAATHMLIAVNNGNGSMAQFNHPEFGGCGQWMRGGMTMVSDLFNYQLKNLVDSVCNDISNEIASHRMVPQSGSFQSQSQNGLTSQSQAAGAGGSNSLFEPDPVENWWPDELGTPAAVGSQNDARYAYFPSSQRLAVKTGRNVWVYDTLHHSIGGFSQQQGGGGSITFSSQFGTVNLSTLPVVSRDGVLEQEPATPPQPHHQHPVEPDLPSPAESSVPQQLPVSDEQTSSAPTAVTPTSTSQEDVIDTLDRLGGLVAKGYVTDEEFAAKKAELLSRL